MPYQIAPRVDTDLDDIWLYVAKESSSIEIANLLIDTITDRFPMIGGFPHLGRSREAELGRGHRSLAVGDYVIVYRIEDGNILILRVVHGRRNLERLLGHQ
jgi:toxin ParE1/3/4